VELVSVIRHGVAIRDVAPQLGLWPRNRGQLVVEGRPLRAVSVGSGHRAVPRDGWSGTRFEGTFIR
jgi:hypothetical protein